MALGRRVPGASGVARVRFQLFAWAIFAWLAVTPTHALYSREYLTAFRIPDNSLKMDGRPDSLWRAVAGMGLSTGHSLSFKDTEKMVVLAPETVRNDDPSKYVKNPVNGSITMLAAYDNQALYFFFLVKTKTVVNAKTVCPALADAWKADAAEVFVDPSPWDQDPAVYRSYFTADASGLVYGTSPKTIQVDKPISRRDSTRFYYRDRLTADKFQVPGTMPAGLVALSSAHSATDTTTVGVEMKIPYWAGTKPSFVGGKTMFISWGFNMYADTLWANCGSNPLAYRWAKNFLNYNNEAEKPPGFHMDDSTHYDPTRSWDGWGPLSISGKQVDEANCKSPSESKDAFNANWDPAWWAARCQGNIAVDLRAGSLLRFDAAGMPVPSRLRGRDVRGRLAPAHSRPPL